MTKSWTAKFLAFAIAFLLAGSPVAATAGDTIPVTGKAAVDAIEQHVGGLTLFAIPLASDQIVETARAMEAATDVFGIQGGEQADPTMDQIERSVPQRKSWRQRVTGIKKAIGRITAFADKVEARMEANRYGYLTFIYDQGTNLFLSTLVTDGYMRTTAGVGLALVFSKAVSLFEGEIGVGAMEHGRALAYMSWRLSQALGHPLSEEWLNGAEEFGRAEAEGIVQLLNGMFNIMALGRFSAVTLRRLFGRTLSRVSLDSAGGFYERERWERTGWTKWSERLQTFVYWAVIGSAVAADRLGLQALSSLLHEMEFSLPAAFLAAAMSTNSTSEEYARLVIETVGGWKVTLSNLTCGDLLKVKRK